MKLKPEAKQRIMKSFKGNKRDEAFLEICIEMFEEKIEEFNSYYEMIQYIDEKYLYGLTDSMFKK